MVNFIEDKEITFSEFKFEPELVKSQFINYEFTNNRPITKSIGKLPLKNSPLAKTSESMYILYTDKL